jgi:L-lactate dehydrogenase complex protein LldE
MLIKGYAQLFAGEPALHSRAAALAARTHEFSRFLTDVLRVDLAALLPPDAPAPAGTYTYHAACHLLRELEVTDSAPRLVGALPGLKLVPLPGVDQCCGFGGLFAVKHGPVSAAMLDKKLSHIRATRADTVLACDMSCLMHIQGALQRDGDAVRCRHVAEVLAEAMGKAEI